MLVNIVTMWLNREMPIESMPAITLNLWNKMCSCLDVSTSIEVQIASLMYQNEAKNWVCSVCFKESTGKTNITRHIEAMHIENHPGYCCDYCNYSTKSRDALRQHINKAHQWPIHNNHLPSLQVPLQWLKSRLNRICSFLAKIGHVPFVEKVPNPRQTYQGT